MFSCIPSCSCAPYVSICTVCFVCTVCFPVHRVHCAPCVSYAPYVFLHTVLFLCTAFLPTLRDIAKRNPVPTVTNTMKLKVVFVPCLLLARTARSIIDHMLRVLCRLLAYLHLCLSLSIALSLSLSLFENAKQYLVTSVTKFIKLKLLVVLRLLPVTIYGLSLCIAFSTTVFENAKQHPVTTVTNIIKLKLIPVLWFIVVTVLDIESTRSKKAQQSQTRNASVPPQPSYGNAKLGNKVIGVTPVAPPINQTIGNTILQNTTVGSNATQFLHTAQTLRTHHDPAAKLHNDIAYAVLSFVNNEGLDQLQLDILVRYLINILTELFDALDLTSDQLPKGVDPIMSTQHTQAQALASHAFQLICGSISVAQSLPDLNEISRPASADSLSQLVVIPNLVNINTLLKTVGIYSAKHGTQLTVVHAPIDEYCTNSKILAQKYLFTVVMSLHKNRQQVSTTIKKLYSAVGLFEHTPVIIVKFNPATLSTPIWLRILNSKQLNKHHLYPP